MVVIRHVGGVDVTHFQYNMQVHWLHRRCLLDLTSWLIIERCRLEQTVC